MRSLAEQTERELGGRLSVLVRQKRDHVRLDGLLERLNASEDTEQRKVLREIDRLVFPHAFAEEAVLWPVIRRVLPDGEQLTLTIEREHQEVNELVTELEGVSLRDRRRDVLLDRLEAVLRDDVRDEEDELLPRLQDAIPTPGLRLLGICWEAARCVAPTRAHPVVARRPPGNVLAALPLSLVDRLRDRVDEQEGTSSVLHGGLGTVSMALTRLAHGLEHLPGMSRGEDPSTHLQPSRGRASRTVALAVGAGMIALLMVRAGRR